MRVFAQVAAGAGVLTFWLNFVVAALLALIGLTLALIEAGRNTGHIRSYFRAVATVCVIVLVAVAIRWYLSTPVEYVVDPTPQPGDPVLEPGD
ncbi:hypothetical protein AB0J42_36335 [Nonomuraea sp. NPDC049649]|uniref:hypothetical protein n=1 Tax=Nonomuraea sp. NPDC049649 TaxID=3155776 RepID=UPI00344A08D1